MTTKPEGYDEFEEWIMRGPGEALFGGSMKASAGAVKRRLQRRLEIPNLFPHLEHEDKAELAKCDQLYERGDKMVRRCRARTDAIKGILDADAGLQITADDLRSDGTQD